MSQFAKPAEMIQKLFGSFFETTETLTRNAHHRKPRKVVDTSPEQNFEDAIKNLAQQRELVVAGNLHVLNTAKIKAKVGEKWPRLKSTIQMNVEKIIQDHLGPNDEMFNYKDLNYVIAFDELDEQEASKKLAHISKLIIQRIFGTDALLEGFELESTAAAIESEQLTGSGGNVSNLLGSIESLATPTRHNMQTIKAEGFETEAPGTPDETAMMDQIQALLDKIAQSVGELGQTGDMKGFEAVLESLQDQLNYAFFTSQEYLEKINNGQFQLSPESQAQQFLESLQQMSAQLNGQLHQVQEDMKDTSAEITTLKNGACIKESMIANANIVDLDPDEVEMFPSHPELLSEFGEDASFQYFPVWDVKLNVVNTYRCSVALTVGGVTRELRTMLPANCPNYMYERLDIITAQKALLDIKEAAASDIVCTFGITIRHSILQNPKTRSVLGDMFRRLSKAERQLLIIEITDVADNTWASRILENVGYLKPFCRAILVRLPRQFQGHSDLKAGGVYAIGYHLPDLAGTEASKFQELDRLVIQAERSGMVTFVSGVDHTSLAASAVGSGVRYIGGTAIGTPLDFPWGILPFELGSIYSRRMSS
ncbi:hypothetical protein [Kordiimonas lacus]|uniref:Uncharacterized protein n=2 Tax=Kordiimonas lacus TaxID=637679 RepID=A0A1G6ZS65_9PROT|nr:hypothetical protein [Kordiimonas lacus]SDE05370.1 hypothetical protein SAMN04488071_1927 [Kordiimonas lacus]